MSSSRLPWVPLVLSTVLTGGGMYGCSMHEWARQGQEQDWITHAFALAAYLGILGFVPAMIWLFTQRSQAERKRGR